MNGKNISIVGVVAILFAAASCFAVGSELGDQSRRKPHKAKTVSKIQRDTIIVDEGYAPSTINVKGGKAVQLTFVSASNSCANGVSIPSLNKRFTLTSGQSKTITFTPRKNETIAFSCTMGMYHGQIVAK